MKECSKSIQRRLTDTNFVIKYFTGSGIDIGGKPDPLQLYAELFPQITAVRTWDMEDGDAQDLADVPDNTYDFVHSSHCLEHMVDPVVALPNWFRVLKPGGHLIVTVPDEDLYEQGVFPSTFNRDHKWTFTIFKTTSWSPKSINLTELLPSLGPAAEILKLQLIDNNYRYQLPRYDQTLSPVTESSIEFVVRKRLDRETQYGMRTRPQQDPEREVRLHLNQYADDLSTLKNSNQQSPPFSNDGSLLC